jgi:hypothetical protein
MMQAERTYTRSDLIRRGWTPTQLRRVRSDHVVFDQKTQRLAVVWTDWRVAAAEKKWGLKHV